MAKALYTTEHVSCANLLDLTPIVPGATVSKPLVNSDAIRQVVFAMDAGQSMSEHRAPFVAVVHVLDGELKFGVDGETRTLKAHDWLVMPPDMPHDLDALKPTRFLLTLVKEATT
ncbi:MAG: cupin domain-containing protein [Phycisphaerales bacterium]